MEERIITPEKIGEFAAYLVREERSGATVEKYIRDVRAYAAYLSGREAGAEETRDYKRALQEAGYAPGSINSMLASVNAFFRFAGWEGCRTRRVRTQKSPFCPEEKELSKNDYLALLRTASDRHALMMETMGSTGIRVSELRFFTVESVSAGEVRVTCKNKTRVVFVPRQLRRLLLDYARSEHIVSGPIFLGRDGAPIDRRSVWAAMKRIAEKAGIAASKVFPHNLRKLFARLFYASARDVVKLADVLGHGSVETTRIYLKTSGVEHRNIVEGLKLVFRPLRV